jgi:hypothetical protein
LLKYLEVYTSLIEYLVKEVEAGVNTTFTALEEKLESALADVVTSTGGNASVEFSTAVSSDNAVRRSTLNLDITLEWKLSFLEQLGLSLKDILANVEVIGDTVTPAISALLGDVLPADGFAEIPFDGVIRFRAGIGLERTVETTFEGTTCYIPGTTGLEVGLSGGTQGAVLGFNGMLGPFSGNFEIDLNFTDPEGGDTSGLSLNVRLDPSKNYYINSSFPVSLAVPSSFEVISGDGVTGLLAKLEGSWNGGIAGSLTAEIPTIDLDLTLGLSFPNLQDIFVETPKIAIFDIMSSTSTVGNLAETVGGTLQFSVKSLSSASPLDDLDIPAAGDLMLGDGAFATFVDSVQQFFDSIDRATFGTRGIVTSIDVPFLKKKIATSLGAGSGGASGNSIFKQAGAKIAGAFDDGLEPLVGEAVGFIAMEVADLLNDVLADFLVPNKEVEPICGCVNETGAFLTGDDCPCDDPDGAIESLMWKIPLGGAALTFEIPLDFELDSNFALDLDFTQAGGAPIELTISWSFLLGIGYDAETGLFIDTFPDEGKPCRSVPVPVYFVRLTRLFFVCLRSYVP